MLSGKKEELVPPFRIHFAKAVAEDVEMQEQSAPQSPEAEESAEGEEEEEEEEPPVGKLYLLLF